MKKDAKIYVAGHRGLVGSAVVRELKKNGFQNLLLKTSKELDLRCQDQVAELIKAEKPDVVVVAAAKVGGILANRDAPTEFLYDNLMIASNLIHESAKLPALQKLLFLGSSCIYPKLAQQPLREEALLTGALEPTNEAYAISKIAGLKLAEYYNFQHQKPFISAMPCNLYGPGDNFHPQNSHVIPGLIRKFHDAKTTNAPSVAVWGTGQPLREFLYIDDLAEACVFLLENYEKAQFLNVGSAEEISIFNLAELVKKTVAYPGKIEWDKTKPDGTPRKVMDSSKMNVLGWKAKTRLEQGLQTTYEWFLKNEKETGARH